MERHQEMILAPKIGSPLNDDRSMSVSYECKLKRYEYSMFPKLVLAGLLIIRNNENMQR